MEISTDTVEDPGVIELKKFIHSSPKLKPIIATLDKYPIWDGEIIVYSSEVKINENIQERVPVQVKAQDRRSKKKIIKGNFSIVIHYFNPPNFLFTNF